MARNWPLVLAVVMLCVASSRAATLDVTTFGATPDGGGDDTAAINNAIQAAGVGDTVFIPAGLYDFSNKIVAKTNVVIAGAGAAQTTLRWNGTQVTKLMTLQNVQNVDVSNLTLDANNSSAPQQGIYATASNNLRIHDLAVKNLAISTGFSPHGIFFDGNVTNSVIQDNTITNIGTNSEWGAGIRLGHGSSLNQVLSNTIDNTGRGGILLDDDSTDVVIKNNTVTRSGGTGLGIELQNGCDRAVVEDNHIDHWLSIDESHNLAVRRNVISDVSGIYKHTGIELVDAHDDVFTDNIIDSGQKYGISISGPKPKERILWARNAIKSSSTWGIQVQGEAGRASRQYFYKNSFQYTIRTGPNTNFAPQGHGVRFNGNADHIVFDANLIDSNLGEGVQLSGGGLNDLTFVHNTITNNVLAAVENGGVANLVWADNLVAGNGNNTQPTPTVSSIGAGGPADGITIDAEVGDDVHFSLAALTHIDGMPAALTGAFTNVLWDFGDGIPSTEFSPMHVYSSPGVFNVMMIGWDESGNALMVQAAVAVIPEPNALAVVAISLPLLIRRRYARNCQFSSQARL